MSFLTEKLIWRKNKTAMIPDENFHGLAGIYNENPAKKHPISEYVRLRSPVFQKPFQTKLMCHLSIVARVCCGSYTTCYHHHPSSPRCFEWPMLQTSVSLVNCSFGRSEEASSVWPGEHTQRENGAIFLERTNIIK